MKKVFLSAIVSAISLLTLNNCTNTSKSIKIEYQGIASIGLSNPSDFFREKSLQIFRLNELGIVDTKNLVALADNKPLPSELIDIDGDGIKESLAFCVDLNPESDKQVEIIRNETLAKTSFPKLTQAELSRKTGGHWVDHPKQAGYQAYVGGQFENVNDITPPEYYTDHSNWIRYEGPGIESDKVGYRIYLDARNGFDIFGKLTEKPVLQNVGLDGFESYHSLESWGMDILKVGQTLGTGGFGYWNGKAVDSVVETSTRSARILNNGAIYSSFKIDYNGWKMGDQTVDATALFSMQAGSRSVHTQLSFNKPVSNLAIGVVKHSNTHFIQGNTDIPGDAYTYIASWGKQSLDGSRLGMAVLFRKRDLNIRVDDAGSYAVTLQDNSQQLDYYFLAAWEKELGNGISSKEAFIQFLEQEAERLTKTPRIRLSTDKSKQAKDGKLTSNKALHWSQWMADSELNRKTLKYHADGWDVNRKRKPKFEYDIVGLLPYAYAQLGEQLNEAGYTDVLQKVTGSFIRTDGSIRAYALSNYNIDNVAPGRAVLKLYKQTGEEKYKKAADILRKQLLTHPRTSEGAFWHKKKYPHQLWLDGVYMGMPFLAEYANLFENGSSLDQVVHEFVVTEKYLRDPATGLYFHGWDEQKQQRWANSDTGLSSQFWGRGVGWLAMALVDTLELIHPDNQAMRQPLLRMTTQLADALKKVRDQRTGTWWQILDKPAAPGNYRESSASAMFVYFYAKAVNRGYLPENYREFAIESYQGLLEEFVTVNADGTISMRNQCLVAGLGYGRDGSYDYYMSERIFKDDPKGTAPFILAGIEISKLLQG